MLIDEVFQMSLLDAIFANNVALVRSLISSDSSLVNSRLNVHLNPPPLVYAATFAHTAAMIEELLRLGAHIDAVDDWQQTACHVAAFFGNEDVLRVLFAHRPNLGLDDKHGRTPLLVAFETRHNERVTIALLEAGAPLDRLCQLAAMSTSVIQALINRGVVFSELRDDQLCTPLHKAAVNGDKAVVNMLIDCGVDVDACSLTNSTCTHVAAIKNNLDALRCFVAAGANVNVGALIGRTALHMVNRVETAIVLLAVGADVNARDNHGSTPLRLKVPDAPSIAHALLAAGADLDAVEHDSFVVDAVQVESARRQIARARLGFVRQRALQVCVGLQSRGLDALQTCEILLFACGPLAPLVAFHHWWAIATTVKHFK